MVSKSNLSFILILSFAAAVVSFWPPMQVNNQSHCSKFQRLDEAMIRQSMTQFNKSERSIMSGYAFILRCKHNIFWLCLHKSWNAKKKKAASFQSVNFNLKIRRMKLMHMDFASNLGPCVCSKKTKEQRRRKKAIRPNKCPSHHVTHFWESFWIFPKQRNSSHLVTLSVNLLKIPHNQETA